MKRESEENDGKTSQSPTSHLQHSYCRDINIPLDLTVEILKKLPAKSLVRFQSVSKQWSTIISSRKDFIDAIVTRPMAQSQHDLHFIFHHCFSKPFFFFFFLSSTYYPYKEHAVPVTWKRLKYGTLECQYVRGLICVCSTHSDELVTIYNPTTRKSISLPNIESPDMYRACFFGYDPVMNQYKVLSMAGRLENKEHVCKVFTLGDPMKQWRSVQGIEHHYPAIRAVHINGTSYYGAYSLIWLNNNPTYSSEVMLMSFNFSSERCDHINTPEVVTYGIYNLSLVNYKGKLGCICCRYGVEIWVMENLEKQEWSKTILCLPDITLKDFKWCHRSCVTLDGKIFLLKDEYFHGDPLYVYYYDPKQNSFRRIEIEATTPRSNDQIVIVGVSDHVENTMRL